jgi:signal recognition particle receptor subunit alpha
MNPPVQLVAVNNPDKIIFVGEALVGNEAIDQLTKFDRALRDFSSASGAAVKGRGIDGMLVTKWDTVDDKVSIVSRSFQKYVERITAGWGCTVDDVRYWATHHLRWLWTGMTFLSYHRPVSDHPKQTYTDLRQLRVSNVVQAILSD